MSTPGVSHENESKASQRGMWSLFFFKRPREKRVQTGVLHCRVKRRGQRKKRGRGLLVYVVLVY